MLWRLDFPWYWLLNVLPRSGALFLLVYPANHGVWFPLDSAIFHFFNQELVKSEAFLWLVAITNNRAFDGCSLLAMGGLMLSFWLKEDKTGRRRILIIGLMMLLLAVVINQLATAIIPVKRSSPTLFFPVFIASASCCIFQRKMRRRPVSRAITEWCCLFFPAWCSAISAEKPLR